VHGAPVVVAVGLAARVVEEIGKSKPERGEDVELFAPGVTVDERLSLDAGDRDGLRSPWAGHCALKVCGRRPALTFMPATDRASLMRS
jgi:hypothetical protein